MVGLVIFIGLLVLTMYLGRVMQRVTASTYFLVAAMTMLQLVAILSILYFVKMPKYFFWWLQ